MKPTTLFFSFLGAISAASISALPSFAQTTGGTGGTGGGTTTTTVPVTGGNFSFNATYGGLVSTLSFTSATALTSFGTIIVTNGSSTQVSIPAIGVTLRDQERSPAGTNVPSRAPATGDSISASGKADGTIANQSFSNAPFFVNGNILSSSLSPTSANTGSVSITASIASGSFQLPTSFVNGLSTNTGATANSPIISIIFVTNETASKILNAQPVLEDARNFLPPSSLASSRIHPGLGSR